VFFGDKEAQFELARIYLGGDGSSDDIRRGLHYLSVLTEASYAPAQAVLADLYWRGQHVKKDDRRALALATLAVAGAPSHERIWIEDTYATIFCSAPQATRDAADGLAASWRRMFARPDPQPAARLEARDPVPERQCASGERVAIAPPARTPPAKAGSMVAGPSPGLAPLKGGPVVLGNIRSAGVIEAAAKK
jgi:hypothetical protein